MAEVQVNWTEIPGSKIRVTSMAHMAIELAMIKAGYASEPGLLAVALGGWWKIGWRCQLRGGRAARRWQRLPECTGLFAWGEDSLAAMGCPFTHHTRLPC